MNVLYVREFSFVREGAGVGLVKIELPAKIAPRSHKFNTRAVGREKGKTVNVSILAQVELCVVICCPNTW